MKILQLMSTENKYKTTLSFCITCLNRIWQIKQTLPQNLNDNILMKEQIDFILVDFASTDGLQRWIIENFELELQEGYLKYYYTEELKHWHASVAKNTSHLLSGRDILVNLDCDNYTGKNGGKFIIDSMIKHGINNTVIHQFGGDGLDGSYGRISVSRQNFIKIGGYDESFEPMGYQDKDLLIRFMSNGINYVLINDSKYNQAIRNNKNESIVNCSSNLTWLAMHERNARLSKENIKSGKIIANKDKKRIGVEKNIYKLEQV